MRKQRPAVVQGVSGGSVFRTGLSSHVPGGARVRAGSSPSTSSGFGGPVVQLPTVSGGASTSTPPAAPPSAAVAGAPMASVQLSVNMPTTSAAAAPTSAAAPRAPAVPAAMQQVFYPHYLPVGTEQLVRTQKISPHTRQ